MDKYQILDRIGSGSFGSVYRGIHKRTNEYVAIKIEPLNNEIKLLKNEAIVYQYLKGNQGIPFVRWFGKDELNHYMVIDLLGDSLETLKLARGSFSLDLTIFIGIQAIKLLSIIHDKQLVHRDIKPSNFLVDSRNNNLYIIDFGFCKSYISNGKHIAMKKTNSLIGSINYASVNSHDLKGSSRRDDLESLGYLMLYLYRGTLKWQADGYNADMVRTMKLRVEDDKENPQILLQFISSVRRLGFEERPIYSAYIEMLNL